MVEEISTLVSLETYETNAVHLGTQQKRSEIMRFIEKIREDGLYLIDIDITDSRIRTIAKFLGNYDSDRILIVSARQYGQKPARKFAETIGAKSITGRFIPGTLTNPKLPTYIEPEVLMVTDPAADQQALREAVKSGLPIIAICDANNHLRNVDIALPANNKGRKSLALLYWLIARETMKARGKTDDETWEAAHPLDDWESTL